MTTVASYVIDRAVIAGPDTHTASWDSQFMARLEYIAVLPIHGYERREEERLVVTDWATNNVILEAPIAVLCEAYVRLTALDDYFGARALWFLADDLTRQLKDDVTTENLRAVESYIKGIRSEWMRYAQAVAFNSLDLDYMPQNGVMLIRSTGSHPITVEWGLTLHRPAEVRQAQLSRPAEEEMRTLAMLAERVTHLEQRTMPLERKVAMLCAESAFSDDLYTGVFGAGDNDDGDING